MTKVEGSLERAFRVGFRLQRVMRGWSQQNVAVRLGVSRPRIGQIESPSKRTQVRVMDIFDACRLFDCTIDELLLTSKVLTEDERGHVSDVINVLSKRKGPVMALGEFDPEAFARAIKAAPAEALLRDYKRLIGAPGLRGLAPEEMLKAEIIARMERGGTSE